MHSHTHPLTDPLPTIEGVIVSVVDQCSLLVSWDTPEALSCLQPTLYSIATSYHFTTVTGDHTITLHPSAHGRVDITLSGVFNNRRGPASTVTVDFKESEEQQLSSCDLLVIPQGK